jgi:signal transduction histidine kinase
MARILVVEDSPTQAAEVRLVLEAACYDVEMAPDGRQGLERIARGGLDLVLSDIVMPHVDGHELCRQVRATPETRRLPIILFTSQTSPSDVLLALESGADNFLTKPCEHDRLVERVAAVLETRRLREEGELVEGAILLHGRRFTVSRSRESVLDLLVTTLDDAVRQHRELSASQEKLLSANRELEAFSYSVAHDVGAQIRAIDGFAGLLLREDRDALPERLRGWVERVAGATDRMRHIVDDLMRLSRVVGAGLERRETDLAAIAREVAESLLRTRPAPLPEVRIPRTLPVVGDEGLLRVLLENLLGNAWKFTRKTEGAAIELGTRRVAGGRAFFVRDNGAGFDMRYAHKLFMPFERLHSEAEFSGTGVGLTTARRIVERHGGRIWAEGEPGKGATFWFTLSGDQRPV